jgi:glucose/arabinose dehydrogenase
MLRNIAALALSCLPVLAAAETLETSAGPVEITAVATGLDEPWGLDFLPGGGFLVTERGGVLRHYRADGGHVELAGVPDVRVDGQGGLLDVAVARDFAQSREIFLTYAAPQRFFGEGTALAVARLSDDGASLEAVRGLFEMKAGTRGGRHFGSRVVEAPDGMLFVTIGDRGDRDAAQELGAHAGKIVRVSRDGTVPADNPFAGQAGALPEIWSYGHRNPQGAALDLDGRLWAVEHGARGGDEVNLIEKGANYGWPVISYGRHYSGARIGEGTAKPGMKQPAHYWDPSIAPSGMIVYSGALWPEWRGDFFVGSLKFDYISRLERDGTRLSEAEQIGGETTGRVRALREAPDGSIWFLSVHEGAVLRMAPAGDPS